MRYFLGLFTVILIVSVAALIFAEQEWDISPGASYTIEERESEHKNISIMSAGEDKETASLHCLAEGSIKILQGMYKNYHCKPCRDGGISYKSFQIKYPIESETAEIIEHKFGGKTLYVAKCNVTSAWGTLTCSACFDVEK